jgi:hypothetical protein
MQRTEGFSELGWVTIGRLIRRLLRRPRKQWSGIEWVTYDTVVRMPRSQVGLRISQQALTRIDTLATEYDTTRAATVRALLSEALASEPVVAATRRRLRLALG